MSFENIIPIIGESDDEMCSREIVYDFRRFDRRGNAPAETVFFPAPSNNARGIGQIIGKQTLGTLPTIEIVGENLINNLRSEQGHVFTRSAVVPYYLGKPFGDYNIVYPAVCTSVETNISDVGNSDFAIHINMMRRGVSAGASYYYYDYNPATQTGIVVYINAATPTQLYFYINKAGTIKRTYVDVGYGKTFFASGYFDRNGLLRVFADGALKNSVDISTTQADMNAGSKVYIDSAGTGDVLFSIIQLIKATITTEADCLDDHREKCALLWGNGDRVIRDVLRSNGAVQGQIKYWNIYEVDTDCNSEAYLRNNENGQGIIACGYDVPRIGRKGLLIHPSVTNLVDWSQNKFGDSTVWTQTEIATSTQHARVSADGMKYGWLIVGASNSGEIYRPVTLSGSTTYTVIADVRANITGRLFRLKWVVDTLPDMTGVGQIRFKTSTGESGEQKLFLSLKEGDEDKVIIEWYPALDGGVGIGDGSLEIETLLEDTEAASGNVRGYVFERVQLSAGELPMDTPYVRTTGATATAVVPVVDLEAGDMLARLNGGRHNVRTDVDFPALADDDDIYLWTLFQDAGNYLSVLFRSEGLFFDEGVQPHLYKIYIDHSGTEYEISSVHDLDTTHNYRVQVVIGKLGNYRVVFSDRTTGNRYVYTGTIASWTPLAPVAFRLGADSTGTGQQWIRFQRHGVLR